MSRWYGGRWRTEAGIEACRADARRRNPRRVRHGGVYLGTVPTVKQAEELNNEMRAFRAAQEGAA